MSHLLHLFYSLLLGSTFMFAAGTPTLGGISGGMGDSGGSDGATSGGDASDGSDAAAGDATGDGASGDDGQTATAEGADAGVDDPNAPVDIGDGRTVPAKWKTLFEAAKSQGLDKEVKQLFFGQQRLTSKFPGGVNEAVKLADTIQEFGGIEGLGELKADNEAFHGDAQKFLDQPGQWIEETFTNNADASLKAFGISLDYVADHHPEMYDHLMGKVIVNDLDSSPIHEIYNRLNASDKPEDKALAKKVADYYNHRAQLAKKVPEKKVDAERQKLEVDRQKLGTEQEQLRNHTVNSQTIPLLGRNMTEQIGKIAKESGFDLKKFTSEQPEAAQSMRSKILNAVMEKAASDKNFVRNYKSVLKEGDTQRAVNMMNKKHGEILGDIVRQVAKGFGIAKKVGAKPGQVTTRQAASGTGKSGALRVSGKPPSNEIDWGKTGTRIYDGEAVLKNGKVVTWA